MGEMRKALEKLMKALPLSLKDSLVSSGLYFNLLTLYSLTGGQLTDTSFATPSLKMQLLSDFKACVSNLRKTQTMINPTQRSQTLRHLTCVSLLLDSLDVTLQLSPEEDTTQLLTNLKSLVTFESQRHLIQELAFKPSPMMIIDGSGKQIRDYVMRGIELFKDDHLFYKEVKGFVRRISPQFGAFTQVQEEWLESDSDVTSSGLQGRCQRLWLMSYLVPESRNQRVAVVERLMESIQKSEGNVKYPIQEKYLAMMHFCLYRMLKKDIPVTSSSDSDNYLELHLAKKAFTLSFAGLSSSLDIIRLISTRLLTRIFLPQHHADSMQQLLSANNSFYFNNLLAKVRTIPRTDTH